MRMLRLGCGVKKDKIRNEHVRGSVKIAPLTKTIVEKRLKWYGHVRRRDRGHVLRRMLDSTTDKDNSREKAKVVWPC